MRTVFPPINVAAIGLRWVALHRHLPVMDASPAFNVVGVIDRRGGHARAVAAQRSYRFSAETDDPGEAPWLDEVDAVTVATAPMNHYPIIKRALEIGKHVLTEKPFAMTVAEGEDLVLTARTVGRHLAIVHNFQFTRSTMRLLADLDSGNLGDITAVNAVQFSNPRRRLPPWYDELPLGLFYDESPHFLYLMHRITRDLHLLRALEIPSRNGLRTPARPDAYFRGDGAHYPITLHCNFESPVSEWHLVVFGDRQLGIVDVFRDLYVNLRNDGAHGTLDVFRTSLAMTTQHWTQHITSGLPHLKGRLFYGNEEVFERFVRAIRGESEALEPIGSDSALLILRLQHEILDRVENVSEYASVRSHLE